MERRFVIFLILSFGILVGYSWLMQQWHPPRQRPPQAAQKDVDVEKAAEQPAPQEQKPEPAEQPVEEKPGPSIKAAPETDLPEQWVTLGSADPADPYRMLVTLTNRGAALARIELSSPSYCDVDDRSGYLGHVTMNAAADGSNGCLVQVVGAGTPAAEAGLKPGDVITAVGQTPVVDSQSLEAALKKTRPRRKVILTVLRDGQETQLGVTLRRRPLEVIRPESDDPLSMLLTLQQYDQQRIDDRRQEESVDTNAKRPRNPALGRELEGVDLRTANWRVVSADQSHAQFSRTLPEMGLEITKTYRLAQVPEESLADARFPAYHLEFEVEIRNLGESARKVAYRLDGPNGLPTEGKWYAYKVSRNWGGAGLRDFVISFGGGTPGMIGAANVADGKIPPPWPDEALSFIGVDAQYFSAVLLPVRDKPAQAWFQELLPICVGDVDPQNKLLANTSCRLIGAVNELPPGGTMVNRFKLFAGPKKPALLQNKEYRLGELVYFGWPIFAWVAVPLTAILHAFYAVVGNYGLAIIMLTVLVRGCMFPLSLKQAAGAQKMQQLQPEIKKIHEKYKNNVEARTKAQQELFRKHNYNPLSGCLPIFIQLPIFIGLYRALMVAIELRDAPLLSHSIRWCSNLAAPDMLFNWSRFMPEVVNSGRGIFGLGPYFNLLPILTIVLFIWQQKMFMPPPADEQAAMQQKVMKYMMIFMGVLFFKVASGLCIYFIASSLWGLAERRFLPKPAAPAPAIETRAEAKARARQLAETARAKKK